VHRAEGQFLLQEPTLYMSRIRCSGLSREKSNCRIANPLMYIVWVSKLGWVTVKEWPKLVADHSCPFISGLQVLYIIHSAS
jgi:hypothetical protein